MRKNELKMTGCSVKNLAGWTLWIREVAETKKTAAIAYNPRSLREKNEILRKQDLSDVRANDKSDC
jgi:hypothetical protein